MIYPNAAKDLETLAFPYAELFRDFAAALCRPNSTLFVYGYGFGDDHVNRVIREMLTISSTHVVVVSFDSCGGKAADKAGGTPEVVGRLQTFLEKAGHEDQITVLLGNHFGTLDTLVKHYLPRTLVEPIRSRRIAVKEARDREKSTSAGAGTTAGTTGHPSGGHGDDHTA